MKRKHYFRKYLILAAVFISVICISVFLIAIHIKTAVSDMFRLNKELQKEGYYTADFEFKMLGLSYCLNRGNYIKAFSLLEGMHRDMKSRNNMIKIPLFRDKSDEMDFYLNLQNPVTGAFMDDSFPVSTFTGPTGNVLEHLETLSMETGRPLVLKYPLRYLDDICTPEKMQVYLNDVSKISSLTLFFPQTTFHNARDVLSLFLENSIVIKHNLYSIDGETLNAMLKWFYDRQDEKTGLWGPVDKNGRLMKNDIMNTASIIKVFLTAEGKNRYPEFPLRYRDAMCNSFLDEAFSSTPDDDSPENWHEWNLKIPKTIKIFTRYMWDDITDDTKQRVKKLIARYFTTGFEKFYVRNEGAFTNIPYGKNAVLDACGFYFTFRDIGAMSDENQIRLWGERNKTISDIGVFEVENLQTDSLEPLTGIHGVNSCRIFSGRRESYKMAENPVAVFYAGNNSSPDIIELNASMKRWLDATEQSMGNWTSKDSVRNEINRDRVANVPVIKSDSLTEDVSSFLKKENSITIIGFDMLQIPVCKITFVRKVK